jgi:thiopeptide-type bacteriocin biosynthesis protein
MTQRTFIPGSTWLYFKLYTGQKSADQVLISNLYPLVQKLLGKNHIKDFFFIRYSDPDFHLRFRFYMSTPEAYGYVFQAFYETIEPCVTNGLISMVQCDTYQRELERYGSFSMETVERIFGIDSLFQLELLQRLIVSNPDPDNDRWLIAFRLIDDLLNAFTFDTKHKIELLDRMSENYRQEFGLIQHAFTKQLNDKYRLQRKRIVFSFQQPLGIDEVLRERRERLTPPVEALQQMKNVGSLEIPLEDIVYSLLHMTMNRWFRSKNRMHELVIYDFLLRYYKSMQAQAIYGNAELVLS